MSYNFSTQDLLRFILQGAVTGGNRVQLIILYSRLALAQSWSGCSRVASLEHRHDGFHLTYELGLRALKVLVMLVMASSTGNLSMDDAP